MSQYITTSPERWDTIAYKIYGSSDHFHALIQNNESIAQQLKYSPIVPVNTSITIPNIETTIPQPPWRT